MGHRTLSVELVLRALFLDSAAYDQMRDDDNPFIEGGFLIVILSVGAALLNLIGQLVAWASSPSVDAIKGVVLDALQRQSWWSVMQNPQARDQFLRIWDLSWRIFPALFGAPDARVAALNIVAWPLEALLGWLIYGCLAYLFARLLRGTGTLNQTLGTTGLAAAPLLLRGLGLIPFLVVGSVISTWQLICRYRAIRSAHRLGVARAAWATVLPFGVYLGLWALLGLAGALALQSLLGR